MAIKFRTVIGIALMVQILSIGLAAADSQHDAKATDGHEYEENIVGLFVGLAKEGRRENGFALGVEYEYRLNSQFGIGAIAEHTFGDIDAWVFAIPFAYHSGRWKMYMAPGLEDGDAGTESLVRIGAEYGFHRGKWEIAPQIDVDFVDGEEIFVIGVVFARGF